VQKTGCVCTWRQLNQRKKKNCKLKRMKSILLTSSSSSRPGTNSSSSDESPQSFMAIHSENPLFDFLYIDMRNLSRVLIQQTRHVLWHLDVPLGAALHKRVLAHSERVCRVWLAFFRGKLRILSIYWISISEGRGKCVLWVGGFRESNPEAA